MIDSPGLRIWRRLTKTLMGVVDLPIGWTEEDLSVSVFLDQFRIDSLQFVELEVALEKEFEISLQNSLQWQMTRTLGQAHEVIMRELRIYPYGDVEKPEITHQQELEYDPEDEIPF